MITWNKKYELGIDSIDLQHQKWISIMNELFKGGQSSENRQKAIIDQLQAINEYSKIHFNYEESLFSEFGYENALEHHGLHLDCSQMILKFQKEAANGNVPMASVLLTEMTEWLNHHICVEDQKYVEFLKSKGVV